jgi:hypothetical protein
LSGLGAFVRQPSRLSLVALGAQRSQVVQIARPATKANRSNVVRLPVVAREQTDAVYAQQPGDFFPISVENVPNDPAKLFPI